MPTGIEEIEETNDVNELEPSAPTKGEGEGEAQGEDNRPKAENDEMRQAITELATTVKGLAKPKEKEEEKLTPEQIEELWGVFKPEQTRPDFMRKFFRMNPDATEDEIKEAREHFDVMHKGIVKQAVTGAKNYVEIMASKLREEMKEALDFVSEAKVERLQKKFYSQYPALQDPKYAKIVDAQAKALKDKTFDSEEEYFKALAEGAAEPIKALVPDFDLGKKPEKKPAATTSRLPRTSQGGQGGAGGGGKAPVSTSKNDIDELD